MHYVQLSVPRMNNREQQHRGLLWWVNFFFSISEKAVIFIRYRVFLYCLMDKLLLWRTIHFCLFLMLFFCPVEQGVWMEIHFHVWVNVSSLFRRAKTTLKVNGVIVSDLTVICFYKHTKHPHEERCCITVNWWIWLAISTFFVEVNGSVWPCENWSLSSHPREHRTDFIQNGGKEACCWGVWQKKWLLHLLLQDFKMPRNK